MRLRSWALVGVVFLACSGVGLFLFCKDKGAAGEEARPSGPVPKLTAEEANAPVQQQISSSAPPAAPPEISVAPEPGAPAPEDEAVGSVGIVGEILAEPGDDFPRIAKKLAAVVANPLVPIAEREEALSHALNLSVGSESEVLTPLVNNPAVTDELATTVLSEALNRPLGLQAELYLAALTARKSPAMQQMIRAHLAFLTDGVDLGPYPAPWAAALDKAKQSWAH